eukprot:TRINITY_DN6738_c0_g1_i2.p1 TRINITY_DN6738_c0_g1~~TRINITY_DN6738_c0_g1_i2.p1  ORF type:complete len:194 (-),score=46.86 TRINITY_DN6738_c0_g1_i2:230-811(-)
MGGKNSKVALKRKELDQLVAQTHFDQSEVKALFEHYKSISGSVKADGLIDKEEFCRALKLSNESMITDRLFRLFDENGDGDINFREFVCGLSVFCKKGTFEEKLHFSFNVYDLDGDGRIDKDEMTQIIKATLVQTPLQLSESQIQSLIDSTFAEADSDGDGRISFEEYKEMVMKHPNILNSMTIESPVALSEN